MKNGLVWVIIILLAALAAWYFSVSRDQAALENVEVRPMPAEPIVEPEPPQFPVERIARPAPAIEPDERVPETPAPAPDPLPTLAGSDPEILEQAAELWPEAQLAELLVPEFVLSRLVATIDGLDARRLPQPMRPLKPVPGRFAVLEGEGQAVISPANGARYQPYLDMLDAAGVESVLPLYLRYYPLLQEAYLGLGYEDVYFNDRLVEIIDHLLATPEPMGLIEVVQNEAVYEFVDPELEALSVGQKALLRLTADDRSTLKTRLRRLRAALAGVENPGN